MKKIEAIIREEKFKEIHDLLEKSGIGGLTVTKVKGFGKHRNGLKPKYKLEIYADEFQVDKVVDLICRKARTGTTGDGKIAVEPLETVYRIRTGEKGANAI